MGKRDRYCVEWPPAVTVPALVENGTEDVMGRPVRYADAPTSIRFSDIGPRCG